MRVQILLFLMAWGLATGATAQPDAPVSPGQEQAVRATLDALFDGMRAGDSTAVRSLFAPGARIRSVEVQGDAEAVETRTADEFARAVGQARDVMWDERIWDVDIRVDGPMAAAWMPYVFYVGDERSHCGVNSVHFVRRGDAWRIQHITYTRREECDVPPEVRK
jgi:hypothetical protein